MDMPDQPPKKDLIWITAAMVEYGHSRVWFTERIKDGRLHTFPQPGEVKVYLLRSEIEEQEKRSA
jgi:hypothetical protein